MKNYSNAARVRFEELRGVEFGDIGLAYFAIGDPYQNPIRIFDVFNDTDASLLISFDGVTPHIYMPAHSGRIYDYGSNRQANSDQLEQEKMTQAWVTASSSLPTLGGLFVTVIYASND
jgi:hypothetical protein